MRTAKPVIAEFIDCTQIMVKLLSILYKAGTVTHRKGCYADSFGALQGLSRTLFERLQRMYGESVSEMLTVQYRMHASIMDWSSQELYNGKLSAHPSVASHTLADMQVVWSPFGVKQQLGRAALVSSLHGTEAALLPTQRQTLA